jgi:hypothetical protein
MAHARYADKRDLNEAELLQALRVMGCHVWKLGREICDLLVLCPDGRMELAEVKNPERSWHLTDNEEATRRLLLSKGRTLWILQTAEDCARLVQNVKPAR